MALLIPGYFSLKDKLDEVIDGLLQKLLAGVDNVKCVNEEGNCKTFEMRILSTGNGKRKWEFIFKSWMYPTRQP